MQLTIFDVVDDQLNVGDPVQIINVSADMDTETYYYLQDFANKTGRVDKVVNQPSLQYHVDFNGKTAIVYHHELEVLA